MKNFTFMVLCVLAAVSVNAQIFLIDSPADLAGNYEFSETVDYGANLLDDVWCGELMMGDDGIDPDSDGCTPLMNDLTDKIAVIDRGACNFSLKSYHAQAAGAVACIIVNINPGEGLIGMLGGDSMAAVVIPTIFISFEDGEQIKTAMASGTVSACMGNIVFDNNIAIAFESVQVPLIGTIPADQITVADDYTSFTPAADVSNDGTLDQTNIVTSAVINFTATGGSPSEVYNESVSTPGIAIDTNELSSLPVYDFTGSAPGVYDVTYNVSSDATDELESDNTVSTSFSVTTNIFSKGSWDYENNRPNRNTAFTIDGGGPIEMISGFSIPNGVNHTIDSVLFYCSTNNDNLDGLIIKANIYEWNDLDGDSSYQNNELTLVGINNITFDDTTNTAAWVTLPVLDAQTLEPGYAIPADGGRYLVGTRYEGADFVFFGFYDNYDHTVTDNLAAFPTFADFPYFQVSTFPGQIPDIESGGLFADFFGTTSTALFVNDQTISTKDVLAEADASINLYPNPTSNLLTAEVELAEQSNNLTYKITDAQGRLIFNTSIQNVTADKAEFNVAQLPAGQYYMTIYTDKGIQTKAFTVNR